MKKLFFSIKFQLLSVVVPDPKNNFLTNFGVEPLSGSRPPPHMRWRKAIFPKIDITQQPLGLENCLIAQNVQKVQVYVNSKRTFSRSLHVKYLTSEKSVVFFVIFKHVFEDICCTPIISFLYIVRFVYPSWN